MSDEVVNLAAWCRNEMEKDLENENKDKKKEEFSFDEIMKQNKEKQEKLAKERAKNNSSVTRSYRLKN